MKALEMFEGLGYMLVLNDNNDIKYYFKDGLRDKECPGIGVIHFSRKNKCYAYYNKSKKEPNNKIPRYIQKEDYQAIHQQMKELGWLDDQ